MIFSKKVIFFYFWDILTVVNIMKNYSIWSLEKKKRQTQKLKENKEVDVLIIGGGITGLSILYQLKGTNLKTILVERDVVGAGVTSKMTGKISYLQGIVYSKIEQNVTKEFANLYLKSQVEAMNSIKNIIEKEKIDCNLEKVPSLVYSNKLSDLQKEYFFLKEHGMPVVLEKNSIAVPDSYVFHPVKYVNHLANLHQQDIYEQTAIFHLKKMNHGYIAYGEKYHIKAKYVILACHYPFELFPFFLPLRTYPEKSFVLAKEVSNNLKESTITDYPDVISKRYYQDEKIYEIFLKRSVPVHKHLNSLENFVQLLHNNTHVHYIWSNEDLMTGDNIPYIGKINKHLLIATGYNTWGITNSTIAGIVIKDILLEKNNPYVRLFSPKRSFNYAKLIQYSINVFGNIKSFLVNKLYFKKKWYPKNLKYIKKDGKTIAIYQDKKKSYAVIPTCPHMGCSLIFNEVEKTWDCPCHASRFDITGKCIKGPSKYNISYSILSNDISHLDNK